MFEGFGVLGVVEHLPALVVENLSRHVEEFELEL